MAISVMSEVWKRAPVDSGELLLLLALADNSNERGKSFPGVKYLAQKARMTRRNVQLCLRKLESNGLISVMQNAGRSGTNLYRVQLDVLSKLPVVHDIDDDDDDDDMGGEKFSPPSTPSKGGENISPGGEAHFAPGAKNEASGGEAHFALTVIEPSEEPLSAHARTREPDLDDGIDAKADKRAFLSFVNNWPGFAGMSQDKARREWGALSVDDRKAAAASKDAWIALLRRQGKDHTPAPSTYLRERLWEAVPEEAAIAAPTVYAPPFGKAWWHHVLKLLEAAPASLGPMPAFLQKQIEAGTEIGRREARDRQARCGWPNVNAIYQRATDGKGVQVPTEEAEAMPDMEAVAVDSRALDEWRIEFMERGLPWPKVPDGVRYVWLPKRDTPGLWVLPQHQNPMRESEARSI